MSLAYTNDPRPAARPHQGYADCALLMRPISGPDCERRSSSTNELACKRCPSPFRTCIPCFKQGFPRHAQGKVAPKTGMCRFHTEHGPETVRIYVPPQGFAEKEAPPPAPRYAPLEPACVELIPEAVIAHGARAIYPDLVPTYRNLMRHIAAGTTSPMQLARELSMDEDGIYVRLNALDKKFGFEFSQFSRKDRQVLRMTALSLIYQRANQQ